MSRNSSPDPIQVIDLPKEVIDVADQLFDLVLTHDRNAVGNTFGARDEVTGQHLSMGPLVVCDNEGNLVISGGE